MQNNTITWSDQLNRARKTLRKLEIKQKNLKKLRNAFSINNCETVAEFELQGLRQSMIECNKDKIFDLQFEIMTLKDLYDQEVEDEYLKRTSNNDESHNVFVQELSN